MCDYYKHISQMSNPTNQLAVGMEDFGKQQESPSVHLVVQEEFTSAKPRANAADARQRKPLPEASNMYSTYSSRDDVAGPSRQDSDVVLNKDNSWRRILLLIIAITIHNIPGIVC